MDRYWAVACQGAFSSARNKAELNKNIDRALEMVRWGAVMHEPAKLFAFGEMNICGFPDLSLDGYRRMSIQIPGPETDRFVELAKELDAYIVPGSWVESRPEFPDAVFNTCFLAGPDGILAKYAKVNPVCWAEKSVSPHSLLDSGYDVNKNPLFPVAVTDIGNIGMFICYDAFFPEVTRQLAYNGAEILVGVTGDFYPGGDRFLSYWNSFTKVRSAENMCYGLYPNGGATVSQTPPISSVGRSQIVDFEGRVLTELDGGEAITAARFDLGLLRDMREGRPTAGNLLESNRCDAYDYLNIGKVARPHVS